MSAEVKRKFSGRCTGRNSSRRSHPFWLSNHSSPSYSGCRVTPRLSRSAQKVFFSAAMELETDEGILRSFVSFLTKLEFGHNWRFEQVDEITPEFARRR